jgi:hypothetical protein
MEWEGPFAKAALVAAGFSKLVCAIAVRYHPEKGWLSGGRWRLVLFFLLLLGEGVCVLKQGMIASCGCVW